MSKSEMKLSASAHKSRGKSKCRAHNPSRVNSTIRKPSHWSKRYSISSHSKGNNQNDFPSFICLDEEDEDLMSSTFPRELELCRDITRSGKSAEEVEELIHNFFSCKFCLVDLREATRLDYFTAAMCWANQHQFRPMQMCSFFLLLCKLLYEVCVTSDSQCIVNLVAVLQRGLKESKKSWKNTFGIPPLIRYLSLARIKAVLNYLGTTLFPHLNLYKVVFAGFNPAPGVENLEVASENNSLDEINYFPDFLNLFKKKSGGTKGKKSKSSAKAKIAVLTSMTTKKGKGTRSSRSSSILRESKQEVRANSASNLGEAEDENLLMASVSSLKQESPDPTPLASPSPYGRKPLTPSRKVSTKEKYPQPEALQSYLIRFDWVGPFPPLTEAVELRPKVKHPFFTRFDSIDSQERQAGAREVSSDSAFWDKYSPRHQHKLLYSLTRDEVHEIMTETCEQLFPGMYVKCKHQLDNLEDKIMNKIQSLESKY